MRDLNKYAAECIKEIRNYGIDEDFSKWKFVVDGRCSNRMGQCRYSKKEIGISKFMLDEKILKDDHWLKDTIIHELLHVAAPRSGHKGKWKALANQVNAKSGGKYNIRRCGDFDEMGIKRKPKKIKYIVECPKCGYQWKYTRMCNTVKYAEYYRCGKDHTNLRLISCA